MSKTKDTKPTDKVVDITDQVKQRRDEEADLLDAAGDKKKKPGRGGPDDPRFVLDCLANNERGDGVLFASLHRDQFAYDKTGQRWLEFPPDGHHWQTDKMGRAITAVEQVAMRYEGQSDHYGTAIKKERELMVEAEAKAKQCKETEDLTGNQKAIAEASTIAGKIERFQSKRKALNSRTDRLRSIRGATNCLTWAHSIDDPLAILGKEIDQRPLLLPVDNGVIDLETGRLRKGEPADWLVKSSPVQFPDTPDIAEYLATGNNCPCPDWDKSNRENLGDDESADFFHRLLGYSITGLSTEHIVTVAIGEGRNGKGTTFELLQAILGDFAWVISPELILEQKNARNSSGAAADLVALDGRRLIVGSETDENRRISGSAVKQLTGGDTIKARPLYQADEINISQTWKLFIHTNSIPLGLTKDFALLQRLIYLKFPYLYVDDIDGETRKKPALEGFFRQKDRGLPARLAKESPGILAWLVRGCILWQQQGLNIPDKIKADIDQLREDEDVLGQFIEGRCDRTPDNPHISVLLKDFYKAFKTWHEDNHGDYVPSSKRVAADMIKRGYRKDKVGGNIRLFGITVRFDPDAG